LAAICARAAGVDRSRVVTLDLMLYDTLAPALGGVQDELLFSARLDNLAMSHAAVTALVRAAPTSTESDLVPLAALFDHEEVGSQSATGAESSLLPRVMQRIVQATGASADDLARAQASSLCVSADMAHALHPNYPDRHEPRHRPVLNGGPVIKVNSQQRYATSARTAALFSEICREVDVPVQTYAHRTDLPCGTTIGPITSTLLGIPTVDVGNPMLSMHSAREMAGARDPEMMTRVLTCFFTRGA
jgi:aspartyl aminopeptidase